MNPRELIQAESLNAEWYSAFCTLYKQDAKDLYKQWECICDSLCEKDRNHNLPWAKWAAGLLHMRNPDATLYFQRDMPAIEKNPYLSIKQAAALARLGKIEEALQGIKNVYEQNPTIPNGYASLALMRLELGDTKTAEQLFQCDLQAKRITPGNRLNAAVCFAACNKLHEARKQVEQAYAEDDSLKDGYSRIARFLSTTGEPDTELLSWYEEDHRQQRLGERTRIMYSKALFNSAIILSEDAKTFNQAIEYVKQAYRLNASLQGAYSTCGWIRHGLQKDFTSFREYAEQDIPHHRMTQFWAEKYVQSLATTEKRWVPIETRVEELYAEYPAFLDLNSIAAWDFYGRIHAWDRTRKLLQKECNRKHQSPQWTARLAALEWLHRRDWKSLQSLIEPIYQTDQHCAGLYEICANTVFYFMHTVDARAILDKETRRTDNTESLQQHFATETATIFDLFFQKEEPIRTRLQDNWTTLEKTSYDVSEIKVQGSSLKLISIFDALVQFREIFLEEQYAFDSQTQTPYILDGGGNIGMAIAYFKHKYPHAEIEVFEPNPDLCMCLHENIKKNNWKQVSVNQAALGSKAGEAQLCVPGNMPMAGSICLHDTQGKTDKALSSFTVPIVPLSKLLIRPIDFMKLDIEGMETAVLKEAGERLRMVRQGVIEYHYRFKEAQNRLSELLNILEQQEFIYSMMPSAMLRRSQSIPVQAEQKWSCIILFRASTC